MGHLTDLSGIICAIEAIQPPPRQMPQMKIGGQVGGRGVRIAFLPSLALAIAEAYNKE